MSLVLNGNWISSAYGFPSYVTLNNRRLNKVTLKKYTVWLQSTDGWASVWIGPKVFNGDASISVSDVYGNSTVRLRAKVMFKQWSKSVLEGVDYEETSSEYYRLYDCELPNNLKSDEAYVTAEHKNGKINLKFYSGSIILKGIKITYTPLWIEVYEVKIKV